MSVDDGGVPAGVLSQESIRRLLAGANPLVDQIRSIEHQLQPQGVDLTVEAVWRFLGRGALGPERQLPLRGPVQLADGWYRLSPGPYVITLHESLNMPLDLMALAFPRSTLLRCGARLGTAVIDAGYHGQLEALLLVENPFGLDLAADATICQVVFFPLNATVEGYRGFYQGNLLVEPSRGIG